MNIISSYNSTVILICLLYVIITGLYTSRKVASNGSLYFYADKASSAWKRVLSLFSLNFPGEYFLGVMLLGFSLWWAAYPYEAVCLLVYSLAVYFIFPLIMEERFTVSQEEFEARFGKKVKLILSSITIVAGIFFRLSLIIITAGILFNDILGWNLTTFILLMILASGICSVAGGLVSVTNLQLFQFILLAVSFILLISFGIKDNIFLMASEAGGNNFNFTGYEFIKNINWIELFFIIPIFALWYWYNEHNSARKYFSAAEPVKINKPLSYSRVIKALSILFFFMLGISSRSLSPELKQENILTALINNEGVNIAVRIILLFFIFLFIIQAMSTVFISASTHFAKDFLEPKYGQNYSGKILLYSRFALSVLVIVTIFFVPFANLHDVNSYMDMLRYQLCIIIPMGAVYTLTLFKNRITSAGITAGLVIGESLAILKILADVFISPGMSETDSLSWFFNMPVLQSGICIYIITVISIVIISHLKTVSIFQYNN